MHFPQGPCQPPGEHSKSASGSAPHSPWGTQAIVIQVLRHPRGRKEGASWGPASFPLSLGQSSCVATAGFFCEPLAALTSRPPVLADTAKPGQLRTIPIPVARCHTYSWNQDSFGKQPAGAFVAPPTPTPSCFLVLPPAA